MVTPDHIIVALIVCGALAYLGTRFRGKKEPDCCCGKSKTRKPLPKRNAA